MIRARLYSMVSKGEEYQYICVWDIGGGVDEVEVENGISEEQLAEAAQEAEEAANDPGTLILNGEFRAREKVMNIPMYHNDVFAVTLKLYGKS